MACTPEFPWPAAVPLRDGSTVAVRPIEPGDRERLRRGFERLSFESRYRRFLSAMPQLSESQLSYLIDVDHHDHEALIAIDPASGEAVAVARYVRTNPDAAECAVTVADDWQGRGLGTAMLELLAGRAREEQIVRLHALVLADNEQMLDLLQHVGPAHILSREDGTVAVESELPSGGVDDHLRSLLRMVAEGKIEAARGQAVQPPSDRDEGRDLGSETSGGHAPGGTTSTGRWAM
jgi:RimJ/RimL family protein N-acetyltransferase